MKKFGNILHETEVMIHAASNVDWAEVIGIA